MAWGARACLAFLASVSMFFGSRVLVVDVDTSEASPRNSKRTTKCVYTWQGKEGSPESKVSFGVPNCRVYCKPAVGEYRFDKVFAEYFTGVTVGKKCSCQNSQGEELFKMPGACPKDVADRCYADYLKQATDTYKDEFKKNAATVVHQKELYHADTFKPTCLENECPEGDCFDVFLPLLEQTRTAQEKKIMAEIVKQAVTEGPAALTREQKVVVEQMGQGELRDVIEMALEDESSDEEKEELRKRLDDFEERAAQGEALVVAFEPKPEEPEAEVEEKTEEKPEETPEETPEEQPEEKPAASEQITNSGSESDSDDDDGWPSWYKYTFM
eukprot:TRINITY_DN63766_c0_g1_i2.p1 TRINITY_DN63766_c0_g1~~TRINITY_DN63766_c0_g1_i2.p1  ORF type:complete len:350 (+),score=71.24 TRINITY_DN63766_c0_g1_i2:69-1052(+)